MTLFQSLLTKSKSGVTPDAHNAIDDEFRRMELESQSRRDGIDNLSQAVSTYVAVFERHLLPATRSLAKALVQQGKFYQEKTDYSRQLVRLGELFGERADRERAMIEEMTSGLMQSLTELNSGCTEVESSQKTVEARRAALEDRKARLARKPKPELEEQVRGAEMLFKEALDKLGELMELLKDPTGNLIKQLENGDCGTKRPAKTLPLSPPCPTTQDLPAPAIQANIAPMAPMVPMTRQVNEQLKASQASIVIDHFDAESTEKVESEARGEEENEMDSVINSDEQVLEKRSVKAVFNFEGQGDELSFEKGQTLTVVRSLNDGWLLGELEDGKQGIFPANYVKEVIPPEGPVTEGEKRRIIAPKPSASKTISLDFDEEEGGSDVAKTTIESPHAPPHTSPLSPIHPAAEDLLQRPPRPGQNRTFSYIPQLPPNGFAGLRKAPTHDNLDTGTLAEEPVVKTKCSECGCNDYSQNVFKRDSCNNCFHIH